MSRPVRIHVRDGWYHVMLSGFIAVVHSDDTGMRSHEPGAVQRGPARDRYRAGPAGESDLEWPMYRRDGTRGAYLPGAIPARIGESWRADVATANQNDHGEWRLRIGRPLTPPVVAGGLVLLAEPTTHQVICFGPDGWKAPRAAPPSRWFPMARTCT